MPHSGVTNCGELELFELPGEDDEDVDPLELAAFPEEPLGAVVLLADDEPVDEDFDEVDLEDELHAAAPKATTIARSASPLRHARRAGLIGRNVVRTRLRIGTSWHRCDRDRKWAAALRTVVRR